MADNYLEKKMEELRSGKLAVNNARSCAVRQNTISFPFRSLRVLIVGDNRHCLRQYADPFRSHECRIAVFNTIPEDDTDFNDNSGVRYYNISAQSINAAMADLIMAWRDIDVVIKLDNIVDLTEILTDHKQSLPYPNDWGMPVLTVEHGIVHRSDVEILKPVTDIEDRDEARILPFLSLKSVSYISEIRLS